MANVRPFKAYRPAPALAAQVAALPYDVYSDEEVTAITEANPLSFLHITAPEPMAHAAGITEDRVIYEGAGSLFREWSGKGVFEQDQTPCYYIYELNAGGRSQTGIMACVSIDDYYNKVIKQHEKTRADKEAGRVNQISGVGAQTGPVFLAYRKNDAIQQLTRRICSEKMPANDFVSDDGVHHRTWVVSDPKDVHIIAAAFKVVDALYIADGHHRAAAASRVGLDRRIARGTDDRQESDYFMAVLYPDSELEIVSYNRVIKSMNGLSKAQFLLRVGEKFDIREIDEKDAVPARKGEFSMYMDRQWYMLTAHEDLLSEDAVDGLEVSILQNHLFHPVLGIEDPKTDPRIDFVGGVRGIEELKRRCENDCCLAFYLYPTSMDDFFAVADQARLMPPKSTWFEPKPRSGLFVHAFD